MKIQNLLFALSAFVFVTSCGDDNGNDTPLPDNEVQFHSAIAGQVTRAEDNVWQAEDAIGIFMVNTGTAIISTDMTNKHYKTVTGDGTFAPINTANTMYYPTTEQNVDFISYYPYQDVIADLTYKIDVSNQSNQADIDLLFSNNAINKNKVNKTVELNFFHKLSKIVFKIIPGEGVTQTDLDNLEVRVNGFNTQANFSLAKDSIGNSSVPAILVTRIMTAGKVYESIILPVKIAAQTQVIFDLKNANNDSFTWEIPIDTEFESGKKHNYNVTIKRTDVSVVGTIEDWIDGTGDDVTAE